MTELELIDIFADNLRGLIDENGISQNQLAREMNVSRSVISRYVNGRTLPSIKVIINLCQCLGCDLDDLIPNFDMVY